MKNILETCENAGDFSVFVKAVKKIGLTKTLNGHSNYTLFAPTDKAFSKLKKVKLKQVMRDKKMLKKVLTNHVVQGKFRGRDVEDGLCTQTVQGSILCFDTKNGPMIENANIIQTDINCSNGIIHVIDKVLLPSN